MILVYIGHITKAEWYGAIGRDKTILDMLIRLHKPLVWLEDGE